MLAWDRPIRFRAALAAIIGFTLVWLVIAKSYVAYLSDDPSRISSVEASEPTDALARADAAILARVSGESGPQSEFDQNLADLTSPLRAASETILRRDPLNARVLRLWGQLAYFSSDEARTDALMQAAARRSLQESDAVFYLMQRSYQRGDYSSAASYADALLRSRPHLLSKVAPTLGRMAENGDAVTELNKLLAANPPWRGGLLSTITSSITDARTPLNLLLSLRESSAPPTSADLHGYINFLIGHKLYELAYYTWLQFLSPGELSKVGFLYNGSFESAPSSLPFDWVISRGSGVTIDIVPKPDEPGQRALFIEFGYGRVEFNGVRQIVLLSPGTYKFEGKYKGDVIGRRGLVWRIACLEGPLIGQSEMVLGTRPEWKDFSFTLTVPPSGCRAQSVNLVLDSRSASEQFVSGSIWYDDLEINRVASTATAQKAH